MAKTMKAAVVREFGKPLVIEEAQRSELEWPTPMSAGGSTLVL